MPRRCHLRLGAVAVACLAAFADAPSTHAHDLERTTVHLTVDPGGAFTLRLAHDPAWLLLRMESFARAPATSGPDPTERDRRLRDLAPAAIDRVVLFVDGQEVRPTTAEYEPPPSSVPAGQFALAAYTLRGQLPKTARRLRWYYGMVADPYPLTLTLADGTAVTEVVLGDAWSTSLSLGDPFAPAARWRQLRTYLALGYTHALARGLGHMLFVLGLFLLRAKGRPVLMQAAAFTLAHSTTLWLSLYGGVSLSSRVVEPLIGLSILYIAIENLRTQELTRWRLALVFLFGLLHGLAFAGVLTNLQLRRSDFATALAGFNGGVELGQLTVIAGASLLIGGWRHRPWYHSRVVVPGSITIAVAGLCWTMARLN